MADVVVPEVVDEMGDGVATELGGAALSAVQKEEYKSAAISEAINIIRLVLTGRCSCSSE